MSPDAVPDSPFDGVFGVVPVIPAVGNETVNLVAPFSPDPLVLDPTKTRHSAARLLDPTKTRHSSAGAPPVLDGS